MNKYFLPVYHSELKPWIKWWILKRLGGGESSLKAITISSGTLTKVDKSKALSITEYYGNTVQNGTPTPESPVEVQTISGDNTFRINDVNYRLDFGGKNFLNITATSQTINGVTFTINEDKTVTVNGTATELTILNLITGTSLSVPNGNYFLSGCPSGGSVNSYGLDINNGADGRDYGTGKTYWVSGTINNVRIRIASGTVCNNLLFKPMLEEGTVGTEFSPYVANPIELCKIGDYKDKIVNVDGTWKIEKKIDKHLIKPTVGQLEVNGIRFRDYSIGTQIQAYPMLYCNYFTRASNYKEAVNDETSTPNSLGLNTSGIVLCNISGYTTETEYINFFNENNVFIYNILATPTTETITNTNLISQLNALYEFYVNSSKVTISNNSEIPFEVLLEYYGR